MEEYQRSKREILRKIRRRYSISCRLMTTLDDDEDAQNGCATQCAALGHPDWALGRLFAHPRCRKLDSFPLLLLQLHTKHLCLDMQIVSGYYSATDMFRAKLFSLAMKDLYIIYGVAALVSYTTCRPNSKWLYPCTYAC